MANENVFKSNEYEMYTHFTDYRVKRVLKTELIYLGHSPFAISDICKFSTSYETPRFMPLLTRAHN